MTLSLYVPPHEAVSDEALVVAAGNGDVAAFEELYRRHHVVATRLAERVTGNEDDARDAAAEAFTKVFGVVSSRGLRHRASFRSYLLTAVRHVAIDKVRQRRRVESTDEMEAFDAESPRHGPADSVVRSEDQRLLLDAFKDLPPRSRSVLWLLDVERVSAQEAADALGLTPNNVAQIAARARGRLRHSYIRAHVDGAVDSGCRFTVDHLGSYLEGGLRPLSLAKVDRHVDGCPSCQGRLDELRTAGVVGRRSLLPVLVIRRVLDALRRPRRGLGSRVVGPETLAAQPSALTRQLGSVVSNPTVIDAVQSLGQSPVVQRVVAAVAVATMTVGASSLAYLTPADPGNAANPPVERSMEVAAPTGPVPHPAVVSQPGGAGAPPATVASVPLASDTRVVGTLQSLSTSLAAASVPTVSGQPPAATAAQGESPPVTVTVPSGSPLGVPGVLPAIATPDPIAPSVTPPALTTPPLSDVVAPTMPPLADSLLPPPGTPTPPPGITPPPSEPSVTATPPVSVPPLTTPPLGQVAPLPSTTPPLTTPPLSTPPLTTPPLTPPPLGGGELPLSTPAATPPQSPPALPPPSTPPLTTAPVTTPPLGGGELPLSTPAATPPLSPPGLPPLTTPPVTTPALTTPTGGTDLPPLTTPPLSTQASTAPLSPPALPPLTTPPLTTPALTTSTGGTDLPPLTTPPVTTPATTPPLSPPALPPLTTPPVTTPPLTTPASTTSVGGAEAPPLTTPPLNTPAVLPPPVSAPPVTTLPLSTPPSSSPPLSTPPLSTPSPSTPPLSTASTPPVSTPPVSVGPVSAPPLSVPPLEEPLPDVPVVSPPLGFSPVGLRLFS